MDNISLAIYASFLEARMAFVIQHRYPPFQGCPASSEQVSGDSGISVRPKSEQVSGSNRNGCPAAAGIRKKQSLTSEYMKLDAFFLVRLSLFLDVAMNCEV
jgi:hypothetical protein